MSAATLAALILAGAGEGAREWNQAFGNAAATSFSDAAPIRGKPDQLWRLPLEELLGGPVVAGDRIFVAAVEQKERRLLALDRATGAVAARYRLDKSGRPKKSAPMELVALPGLLATIDEGVLSTWRVFPDSFRAEAVVPGSWQPWLCEIDGFLIGYADKTQLSLIDPRAGKVVANAEGAMGRPAIERTADPGRARATSFRDFDPAGNAWLSQAELALSSPPAIREAGAYPCAPIDHCGSMRSGQGVVVSIEPQRDAVGLNTAYYVWVNEDGGAALCKSRSVIPITFRRPPAAAAGRLFGFEMDGRLIDFECESGHYLPLIDAKELPAGAAQVAPSIAVDVLFHGNWAAEATSGRVLWTLPELTPKSALIPTGDGLAVVVTPKDELVGLGDPQRVVRRPEGATSAKATAPPKPRGPALAPSDGPGLVLADGTYAKGKVEELPGGRFRLTEAAGARELDAAEVAWANLGASSRLCGSEYAVLVAWADFLRGEQQKALVKAVERFLSFKQPAECRRLLEELGQLDAPPAEIERLTQRMSSTSESKADNRELQRKRAIADEKKDRDVVAARAVAAADACGAQGLPGLASALVGRARRIAPEAASIDLARVRPWIPAAFPFRDDERAAQQWLDWCEALLPSGAVFVAIDAAVARRVLGSPFEKGSVALRTSNLLLFTREFDPVLVGTCLSRGESTVRTLAQILGKSPVKLPPRREEQPLEVRLHATRAEFLADPLRDGSTPPEWSAGFYAASEAHSRFYARHENAFGDPLGRRLHEVMSHELAHQYIDRRWVPEDPYNVILSGFWLVEGMAEFFGEQAVEQGRSGFALDDATVRSLETCAALERKNALLPLRDLVSMSHVDFASKLDPGLPVALSLPHHLGSPPIDRRGIFYSESAALVFFVYHHGGERGRQALAFWLKNYYQGHPVVMPWKEAGFDQAADFEAAFKKFLATL